MRILVDTMLVALGTLVLVVNCHAATLTYCNDDSCQSFTPGQSPSISYIQHDAPGETTITNFDRDNLNE